MLPERFIKKTLFIKENFIEFIYKEISGAVIKLKLILEKCNQKFIKKYNHLYFETLFLVSYWYCGDNAKNMDFLQNTALSWNIFKVVTNYYENIHRKKLPNSMHTREKGFYFCNFSRFLGRFFSNKVKKICGTFRLVWVFLAFLEVGRLSKYYLWDANLVSYI